eukprot:m.150136 g.150136  ORF g.150136 m.150136 type:complete len:665 (+) comp38543_c0_seq11:644-2638(+)
MDDVDFSRVGNPTELFDRCDVGRKGYIQFGDFRRLCDDIAVDWGVDEMTAAFSMLDDNGDGRIDRNDFVAAYGRQCVAGSLTEADGERYHLWEEFLGGVKRGATLRRHPALFDFWMELRSSRTDLVVEFEELLRTLASEFDDEVNRQQEQAASIHQAMQGLNSKYESKLVAMEKEAEEQISSLERRLQEKVSAERQAVHRVDAFSSQLLCREAEMHVLETKVRQAQLRLNQAQQRSKDTRASFKELQATEISLRQQLEHVQRLLFNAKIHIHHLETQLEDEKEEGKLTRCELQRIKDHTAALETLNDQLVAINRELAVKNKDFTDCPEEEEPDCNSPIHHAEFITESCAFSCCMENRFQLEPDLVQGMPTHFHNQTALAKPLLSPSPRVRLTQLFKAQSIPAVPEWFAVTWRCDKLREGSDSGNSHDGKLCTTLGYESHSIISVSRSADVDALSWTENGLYQHVYQFVLVGDPGVGKSSYLRQVCYNEFSCATQSTNSNISLGFDFEVLNVMVGDKLIRIQLWDTAGQERFMAITKSYFRKADGVIIVYDVMKENIMSNMAKWLKQAQENCKVATSTMLIGNKVDMLRNSPPENQPDVAGFAQNEGFLSFETSCKTGLNVTASFIELTRLVLHREEFQTTRSKFQDERLKLKVSNSKNQRKCRC